jgi:hypothetical protein
MVGFATLLVLVVQATLGTSFVLTPRAGCSISPSNLDPEPIVVSGNFQFLYAEPDAASISINAGETIIISCPGGTLSAGSTQLNATVSAVCESGTEFTIDGKTVDFNNIELDDEAFGC